MADSRDMSFSQRWLQLSAATVMTRILRVASNFMETGVWNGDLIEEWRQSFIAYLNGLETQTQLYSHLEHQGRLKRNFTGFRCYNDVVVWSQEIISIYSAYKAKVQLYVLLHSDYRPTYTRLYSAHSWLNRVEVFCKSRPC